MSAGKSKIRSLDREEVGNLMSKGFHLLVSSDKPNVSPTHQIEVPSQIMTLPLSDILDDGTFQYRITTAVGSLASDIRTRGQTTPVFVRPRGRGYQLLSGFRRIAALREIGHEKVLARVFQDLSDDHAIGLAISENLQREDFSDLEKALVSKRLRSLGLEIEGIAAAINRSVRTVQQYLAVLNAPQIVQDVLHDGKISLSVAVELARKNIAQSTLSEIIERVAQEELSVRTVKQLLEDGDASKVLDARGTPRYGERRGRGRFQPIRFTSRDRFGFDLVVKFRHARPEDLTPIISALRSTLVKLEQKEAELRDGKHDR